MSGSSFADIFETLVSMPLVRETERGDPAEHKAVTVYRIAAQVLCVNETRRSARTEYETSPSVRRTVRVMTPVFRSENMRKDCTPRSVENGFPFTASSMRFGSGRLSIVSWFFA